MMPKAVVCRVRDDGDGSSRHERLEPASESRQGTNDVIVPHLLFVVPARDAEGTTV
jgi:hypothetical protein